MHRYILTKGGHIYKYSKQNESTGGIEVVQAYAIVFYLFYVLIIAFITIKYHKKIIQLKSMNESFLMAIHDIKNYSVNIDASGQILKAIAESEDRSLHSALSKHLGVIISNCREMNRLIENYSRIIKFGENDRNNFDEEDVISILYEAVKLSEYYAKKKNIIVKIETKWAEKNIKLNKVKFIRVMCNLIMNGIKYSYEGGSVMISILGDDDSIEINVIDNGKGMSNDELKKIFEKHYRSNNNSDMAELSLGIGLYASRHLAREMGGELWAESEEGKGSKFILRLPMKRKIKDSIIDLSYNYSSPTKKTSF